MKTMDKISRIMAMVIGLQLLLILVFWVGLDGELDQPGSLIELDGTQITTIEINDGENTVRLVRNSENWADGASVNDEFPADSVKIVDVLGKILALESVWPVARTTAAHQRFEVGESNFQRRIDMIDSGGSILATLFAGTSPGFGKVHARLLGEEDVFSVKLSNYEIASGVDDWLDKRLLAVDRDPVKISIKRPGSQADSLNRGEEFLWTWNGKKTDPEKVTDYIARFQNLRVLGIAKPQSESVTNQTSIELEFPQDTITLKFIETDEDEFVVTSTKISGHYRMANYSVDRLLIKETDVIVIEEENVAEEKASLP